jgi:hypothetical protein
VVSEQNGFGERRGDRIGCVGYGRPPLLETAWAGGRTVGSRGALEWLLQMRVQGGSEEDA